MFRLAGGGRSMSYRYPASTGSIPCLTWSRGGSLPESLAPERKDTEPKSAEGEADTDARARRREQVRRAQR